MMDARYQQEFFRRPDMPNASVPNIVPQLQQAMTQMAGAQQQGLGGDFVRVRDRPGWIANHPGGKKKLKQKQDQAGTSPTTPEPTTTPGEPPPAPPAPTQAPGPVIAPGTMPMPTQTWAPDVPWTLWPTRGGGLT